MSSSSNSIFSSSQIFLTIVATLYCIGNFVFNFTFLVILLKMRRFRIVDRSFFLLTHLIVVDFVFSFFIYVISGYGVYNNGYISSSSCHVQTYFHTLIVGITFHGLLVLSIERFTRYQNPICHINTFTRRLEYNDEDKLIRVGRSFSWIVFIIIAIVWVLNIFISFFPLFKNLNDTKFFTLQYQCDYVYENFPWFLWFFFWFNMTLPFLASMVFYILTFRLIASANRKIKKKKAEFELKSSGKKKINEAELVVPGVDVTRQPFNKIYYEHVIDPDVPDDQTTKKNDFHVRTQLLTQYKYDTEKSQTITYCIITILSYFLILPVYILHFYRTYNNNNSSSTYPDSQDVIGWKVYTTFVWFSYALMLIKSATCLIQNPFFRDNLYQSANCRGFRGLYDYEKVLREQEQRLRDKIKGRMERRKREKQPPKEKIPSANDDDSPRD